MPRYYYIAGMDSIVNINGKPDTVYHTISDIAFVNQNGEHRSIAHDLQGKILVISFFFADCKGSCPKMHTNLKYLQNSFKKSYKKLNTLDTVVQFLSFTMLPERDSIPRLRELAAQYKANPDSWWFCTADKKAVYAFAKQQLGLIAGDGNGGSDDFLHSEQLVLIDKNRHIRGYYDGTIDTIANKCADDIVLLTLEKQKKHKK